MKLKRLAILTGVLALGAGLVVWQMSPPGTRNYGGCSICLRPIHRQMAALYHDDDGSKTACCVACVFAHGHQAGHIATLDQVTDYVSGELLRPEKTTFVVGSDVHVCAHQEMLMDQTKTPMPVHFDRCEPPVMSFRDAGQAASFAREHNGTVQTWSELVSSLGAPTLPQKVK